MSELVEKRNAAGDKYVAALVVLRNAYTDLAALDHVCRAPTFGPPPSPIELRHPTFAPDFGGTFTDGVPEAVAALKG